MERDRVLDKIRKLMAKAADPCNVHEAAAAAEAAQRLMLLHKIEEGDVAGFTPEEEDPITDIDLLADSRQKSPTSWQQILLGAVARSCSCRLIVSPSRQRHKGALRVFGRRSELDAVRYLYAMLVQQIHQLCERWADELPYDVERRDRNAFRFGAACTIRQRLAEARQTQEREVAQVRGTTALVPLRRAEEAVSAYIEQHVGRTVTTHHALPSSWHGYAAGKQAGLQVSLGGGKAALGKGRAPLPRG